MAYEKENGPGGIQEQITEWANKQTHIFAYWKIHADGFGNAGRTDTLCIFNDAHHKWIEVKTLTGKLSELQALIMLDLWERGCDVDIARSKEEYIASIAYYLKNRTRKPEMPPELQSVKEKLNRQKLKVDIKKLRQV